MLSRREVTGTGRDSGTGTAQRLTVTATGTALPVPVALAPAAVEAIDRYRYRAPQESPATATALAPFDICGTGPTGTDAGPVAQAGTGSPDSPFTGTAPAGPTGTGTASSATHTTGADMTTLTLPDGLPADWIAEDIAAVAASATAASDAGDLTGLRLAFANLAQLTGEALDLLRGEELDAVARHDIPISETSDDPIVPGRDELDALQEVARAGDYDRTMGAFADVVDRIGTDAAGLLICQLITAGSATLIEIIDITEAEREAAQTVAVPVGSAAR